MCFFICPAILFLPVYKYNISAQLSYSCLYTSIFVHADGLDLERERKQRKQHWRNNFINI